MSKHHHHKPCPRNEEEIADRFLRHCSDLNDERASIIDRLARHCCCDRTPEELLPIGLSPEEIREFRCITECLRRCLCRPIDNFGRVEGAENIPRRR